MQVTTNRAWSRGDFSFQRVLDAPVLDFVVHPSREGQRILIVEIDDYAVAAPCKPLGGDEWVIVTAFRNRKYTRKYLE